MKILNRVFGVMGIAVSVFLLPIMVMNVTIIVKSCVNPDKVPDFFGIKPFVVVTESMGKTIDGGDLAIVKSVDPAALQKGDIISFKSGKSVVTHRIIELTETDGHPAFITQGDANGTRDASPVTYQQVEGIYLFKVPKVGHLALFMQTALGMLVFIVIPICCFALSDLIRHKRRVKGEIDSLKALLAEKETE